MLDLYFIICILLLLYEHDELPSQHERIIIALPSRFSKVARTSFLIKVERIAFSCCHFHAVIDTTSSSQLYHCGIQLESIKIIKPRREIIIRATIYSMMAGVLSLLNPFYSKLVEQCSIVNNHRDQYRQKMAEPVKKGLT